jgi:hypothetical protein
MQEADRFRAQEARRNRTPSRHALETCHRILEKGFSKSERAAVAGNQRVYCSISTPSYIWSTRMICVSRL